MAPAKSPAKKATLTILGIALLVGLFLMSSGSMDEFSRSPLGQFITSIGQTSMNDGTENIVEEIRDNPPKDAVGIPMDAESFFGE